MIFHCASSRVQSCPLWEMSVYLKSSKVRWDVTEGSLGLQTWNWSCLNILSRGQRWWFPLETVKLYWMARIIGVGWLICFLTVLCVCVRDVCVWACYHVDVRGLLYGVGSLHHCVTSGDQTRVLIPSQQVPWPADSGVILLSVICHACASIQKTVVPLVISCIHCFHYLT